MAANTTPIFCRALRSSWSLLSTSAVTGMDGTDANVKTIFTADATNGSKIETVYIQPNATNTATVVRFWVNNGSTPATAANNTLVHEELVVANTISQTSAASANVWQANLILPPGYKLLAAQGVATGVMHVTAVGGDY
jgi:hypothetical protein